MEEAKEEVSEIVDFLKDPAKFQKLGGKIPRGVLMVGSPGTGKTLLAKAIAGEAKVPFFTISGSDFVEMFVGVGASRVRDMFEQAKKHAPCIIFIDEIDAVGRHRGAGLGGGHDEREQTLNQLLVEMDGFEGNEGVIVIAATNRPDVLDPALLRPGRFDRQVVVPLPDVRGREQILKVHMRKLPLAEDVKPSIIARGTPGFSGADLANLVNEAALFAARANKRTVSMEEFERAKDKIIMGAERKSMVMDDNEKKLTAYHEAGHAIVGLNVPDHDPVYKVTIIPRGRALGVTMFLPEADRYSTSKRQLESRIATLFGGRVAEEMIFGADSVTTGASNDIERATEIARNMVTKWGLSDRLGPLTYTEEDGEVFLGRSVTQHKQVSDMTAHAIDEEVRRVIDGNYRRAREILDREIDKLHAMADALIKYETIDESQIRDIMDGREPQPPEGWEDRDTPSAESKPPRAARWRGAERPARPAALTRPRSARPSRAFRFRRPIPDATGLSRQDPRPGRAGRHGRPERHPGLVLRWRAACRASTRGRTRRADGGGGRRHRRRRRRIHAARRRAGVPREEEIRRVVPVIERLVGRHGRADLRGHEQARGDARRGRGRRRPWSTTCGRCRPARGARGCGGERCGGLPDAHAGRSASDAGCDREYTWTWSARSAELPRRARRGLPRRRASARGTHLRRSRGSASARRPRSQPRAARRARRPRRRPAFRYWSACRASRWSVSSPAGAPGERLAGSVAFAALAVCVAVRRSSAPTTWRRRWMRSGWRARSGARRQETQ